MRRVDEHLAWWHSDSAVLPSAHPTNPWDKTGAQVPSLDSRGGVRITDAVGEVLTYSRRLYPPDRATSRSRQHDRMAFQIRFMGLSEAAGWGSGASPQGFYINDGNRMLGVGIGSSLDLIDPITGAIIETISTSHPWLYWHHYMLVKVSSERWQLSVDGKIVGEIGYDRAPASPNKPARAGFGSLDALGLSSGLFEQPELGLNLSVPPQWKVLRVYDTIPPAIRARWTEEARALTRTALGMVQQVSDYMGGLWNRLSSGKVQAELFHASGDVLPQNEVKPWTVVGAGAFSLVRGRIRTINNGAAQARMTAPLPAPAVPLPTTTEWHAEGVFVVRETTPDAQGRLGPYINLADGNKLITAELIEDTVDPGIYYWVFTDGALTGALSKIESYLFAVNPFAEHKVEIRQIARTAVCLFVDEQLVSSVNYNLFPGTANLRGRIGTYGPAGAAVTYDVDDAKAGYRVFDQYHRPVQLQNTVEHLIFVAGCESNALLEACVEHHHGIQELRGTTIGIVQEMRRTGGCSRAEVVRDQEWAAWYLELSYPEVTPIYLELDGMFSDVFVEWEHRAHNLSAQEVADLAARYLVPLSVVELQYFIAVAEWFTGPSAVVGGYTRLTMPDTAQFAAGDDVTVHDAANTVREDTTIFQIVSSTQIDVELLTGAYIAGDVIRKVLART